MKNFLKKAFSGIGIAFMVLALAQPALATIPEANATGGSAALNADPRDFVVLAVSNYSRCPGSNGCWGPSISNVQPGEIIAFRIYAHNTGSQPAYNTRVAMSLNAQGSTMAVRGVLSADNAPAVYDDANVTFASSVGSPVDLTFVGGEYYANSSLDPNNPDPFPNGANPRNIAQGGINIGTLQNDFAGQFTKDVQIVVRYRVGAAAPVCTSPTLTVTPSSNTVDIGQTAQYQAVYDSNGNCEGGQTTVTNSAQWTSNSSNIASSLGSGNFRGNAAGTTGITASYQGLQANASITVRQGTPVYQPTLVIAPPSQTINVGNTADYRALYDADGPSGPQGQQDVTGSAQWSSNNTGIATSLGNGDFRGNAAGSTGVRATYNNLQATASITVQNVVCSGTATLVVTPNSRTINSGDTADYRALYDADGPGCPGAEQDVTGSAQWASNNTGIASSLGSGSFRGNGAGSTGIRANYAGLQATASINVIGVPVQNPTLVIVPPTQTINVAGNASYRALYDADGPGGSQGEQDVTNSAQWFSNNSNIASSLGSGNFRGNAAGTTGVRATYNSLQATASLTVQNVVCTGSPVLRVSPDTHTVNVGGTVQYQAVYDSNGDCAGGQQDVTYGASWSSDNSSIASSQGAGRYRGVANGSTSIRANYQGLTDTASINVQGGTVYQPTFVITPTTQTINVGNATTYRSLYDADGPSGPQGEQDVTNSATWSSDNTGIASSLGSGSFRGNAAGSTGIRASYGGLQATASITVVGTQTCTGNATLDVTPSSDTIDEGETADYSAVYDSNGNCEGGQQDVTNSASWTIDNSSIASNLGSGRFRGNREGNTTVRANYSGLTDTANLRVNEEDDGGGTCNGNETLVIVPYQATFGVGQTYQYRALYDSDGPGCSDGEEDVTNSATWNSTGGVVSNLDDGRFRGNNNGTANITARYSGITADGRATVVGGNTYVPPVQQPPVFIPGQVIQQPPTFIPGGTIQLPPTYIGGGTVVQGPQVVGGITAGVTAESVACITVTPSVDVTSMLPGQDFVYTTLYRNDCPFALNNAVLRAFIPNDVEFKASSNPFFLREGQKFSYNLGVLPPGGQGSIAISGMVRKDARIGDTETFTSSIEFTDSNGRIQGTTSYLVAVLGGDIRRTLSANLADTLGHIFGSAWLWIIMFLLILAGIVAFIIGMLARRRHDGPTTSHKVVVAPNDDPLRALRNA